MQDILTSDYDLYSLAPKKGIVENLVDCAGPHEGNQLRLYRKYVGVPLTELSAKTGLPVSVLEGIEGKAHVSGTELKTILDGLAAKMSGILSFSSSGLDFGAVEDPFGARARTYRVCQGVPAPVLAEILEIPVKRLLKIEKEPVWNSLFLARYAWHLQTSPETLLKTTPYPNILGSADDPVGLKIKRCRTRKGISRNDLVRRDCRLNHITVQERRSSLFLRTVYRMAVAMDISIDEIMNG